MRTVYLFAERDYRPEGPFDGELILFRATTGTGEVADEPFVERFDDPRLGWGRRLRRGRRCSASGRSLSRSSVSRQPLVR